MKLTELRLNILDLVFKLRNLRVFDNKLLIKMFIDGVDILEEDCFLVKDFDIVGVDLIDLFSQ